MRVCWDVSPAVHGRAGLGRYVQELAAAILARDAQNEYVAFYNRSAEARVPVPLDALPQLTTRQGDKPWRLRAAVSHVLRLSQDRLFPSIDLFHATDNLLPFLTAIPSVFTLHDLVFRFHPDTVSWANRLFLQVMTRRFLQAADAIIAVSECTKRDAQRLYGIADSKISVVHEGVHERFQPCRPDAVTAVRRRYGLPARYLLFVGTVEPRKNLAVLLDALVALKRRISDGAGGANVPKLVIVGKKGWLSGGFFRRLRELALEPGVVLPGFVPDDDLPAVYSGAACFVFPSLYEGFGLPVLEAMACGAPVICSNASSLPEICGDAALLFDPRSPAELTTIIERVLADAALRGELVERGLRQAAKFTWQRTAERTLDVYADVAGRRGVH